MAPRPGVLRRIQNYIRHDLREIIAPTSIPNPPGVKLDPPLTLIEKLQVTRHALKSYIDSWDSQKLEAELRRRGELKAAEEGAKEEESLLAEFAAAAKGGSQALKPFLANLYASRAASYRDAATQFVRGYREGFQEASRPEPGEAAAPSDAAPAPAEGSPRREQRPAEQPRQQQGQQQQQQAERRPP